jgi:uncharacterized protein YecE (DUF72 family)
MQFFVGTSGYSYKEWKGTFYPEKLPQKEMLGYYAQRFSTVEINNTFYRMPTASGLESWAQQVPEGFRFVLKAPQKITHHKRLKDAEADAEYFVRTSRALKQRRGPLLFQVPPNLKKDVPRLAAFLDPMDANETQIAFEFRHQSWFDDEVLDCLQAHSCALCIADIDDDLMPPFVATANWCYMRLRRVEYSDADLAQWIEKLRGLTCDEAYVFFKHEDAGTGPKLVARFLELIGA